MIVNNISYDMTVADVAREFEYNMEYVRKLIRDGVLAPAAIKRRERYRINKELATECLARRVGVRPMEKQLDVSVAQVEAAGGESYDDSINDIEYPAEPATGVPDFGTGYGGDDEIIIYSDPDYSDSSDEFDDLIIDV